jgi:phosphopantothenoylcysteine decarboxylase/phosphopantothenate--cysteine ligase
MPLSGKEILVGMTGGIACYKIPYLIRLIRKAGAEVRVIMTEAATKFITPLTMETISDNPVALRMFPDEYVSTRHIDLARWADLIVIAPATANVMGKVSAGIADDLLTTILMATRSQLMIAPAMNPGMWENKVTQRNLVILKQLGYYIVEPGDGQMACDESGVGRMAEPDQIFDAVQKLLPPD